MDLHIEARIARLLDQLEKTGLSESEVERLKAKVAYLQGLQE